MDQPSENDRLIAAAAHGMSLLGFAAFGPALLWLLYKDKPEQRFIAYHAVQAAVFQAVVVGFILVTAFCTFGLSTMLLFPALLVDLWMAYRAYQGEWAGYPGMESVGRGE